MLKGIGLCAQILLIIVDLIINIIGVDVYGHANLTNHEGNSYGHNLNLLIILQ